MNYYPINPEFLLDLELLKKTYKDIIANELNFRVSKNFFQYQDHHYPIKIKFNCNPIELQRPILGTFNPQNLAITVNYHYYQFLTEVEKLNLIRHELAHYLDYIQRGEAGNTHDAHFHHLCLSYGWGKEVYNSVLDHSIFHKIQQTQRSIRQSEKLLALAHHNSSWEEAQSALLKAKELMHNIDQKIIDHNEAYIAIELTSGKRLTQKYQTILQILEHFQCQCIILTTPGHFTLEAITTFSHKNDVIELFSYLEVQIDAWFNESKQFNPKLHRNSFYRGLKIGLEEKILQQERQFMAHQKALILSSKKELAKHFQLLYPKTGKAHQKSKQDLKSFFQGKNIGQRIELKNKIQQRHNVLTYIKSSLGV